MPIVLPTTRPRITPQVTGLLNASPNSSAGRLMPALAEREQRHDRRTPTTGAGRARATRRPTRSSGPGRRRGGRRAPTARSASSSASMYVLLAARHHRCEHAERDAGERGVHVRLVHGEPAHAAERQVDPDVVDPVADRRGGGDRPDRDAQPGERDALGVEDRDHDDRADVVGDREGQQEQLEPRRRPGAEHGDHAGDDRDVGGHRDAPALRPVAAGVEDREDRRPARSCRRARR